jgi:hypothetical protein
MVNNNNNANKSKRGGNTQSQVICNLQVCSFVRSFVRSLARSLDSRCPPALLGSCECDKSAARRAGPSGEATTQIANAKPTHTTESGRSRMQTAGRAHCIIFGHGRVAAAREAAAVPFRCP